MAGSYVRLVLLCILAESMSTADATAFTFTARDDGLHADCSRQQLTSLAVEWPADVVWLDASHNELTDVAGLSDPRLANLRHLDLSDNTLHGALPNNSFAALPRLQWLSLHDNQLQSLQADALAGLGQLTYLDLSNNHLLARPGTYPPGVFRPLTSLQELYLHGNDYSLEGDFPEDMFVPLAALHTLSLNSFTNTQFDWRFRELRKLKVLYLYDCNIHSLTNNTFSSFHNGSLEQLYITVNNGLFGGLETCAFCHLPHLTHLAIQWAHWAHLESALSALYGLQGQTMDTIDFSEMQLYRDSSTVDGHSTRYLRNICVSRLIMRSANIEFVMVTAFSLPGTLLKRCLQEVDISRNRIRGDMLALFALSTYPNLTVVRLEMQSVHSIESAEAKRGHERSDSWAQHTYGAQLMKVFLAPSLEYVNLSDTLNSMSTLPNVTTPNKLRTLDVSYCRMHDCVTTVSGLSALETLAISGSFCNPISESFFDLLTSLLHLRASNFKVDPEFFRKHAWRLFLKLERLQTLDLSLNNLVHLDPRMLRAQPHLRELNLAGNRLQSMSLDVGLHKDLQVLDLSHNMLPTLLPHERQALNALARTHPVSLRLAGNPLLCVCSNLDFIHWLWSTRVQLDVERGNYRCLTETGEVSDTATVMANMDFHWRRCHGQQSLAAASVAFLLQLLALVVVYMVSRSWTHIRYVIKVMKRLRLPRRENFRRDAYVAHAEADCEWACVRLAESLEERRGVRLLLPVREPLHSNVQAENIVIQMDDCWKVMLLVTRAFAEDEWLAGFTVLQAEHSITDTMPDRVIVVLMDDPARLPPMASLERLLRIVPESHVLRFHRDAPPSHPVWDRLAGLIVDDLPRR